MNEKARIIYQFTVLIVIALLAGWTFHATSELDDTLTGALIGVMVGIGPTIGTKEKVITKEQK